MPCKGFCGDGMSLSLLFLCELGSIGSGFTDANLILWNGWRTGGPRRLIVGCAHIGPVDQHIMSSTTIVVLRLRLVCVWVKLKLMLLLLLLLHGRHLLLQ